MFRLSDTERKVLSVVELNARASIGDIQKETNLRPHSVRYALQQLQERKIISPQIWVNLSPLGLTHVFCFFSATFSDEHSRSELNLFLSQSNQVYWFAEIAGEYQYELGLIVHNMNEALNFLNSMPSRFRMSILKKEIFIRTGMTLYSRRYFLKQKRNMLTTSDLETIPSITDEMEMKILGRLSKNPLESNRDIALALNMSPGTINNRVNALKERGVIGGFWYLVNSESINSRMYYLQIYTRGFDMKIAEQLEEFALEHPSIIFLHKGLGAWDFQIHAEISKGEELSSLVELLYQKFHKEIGSIRVFSRLKILKCSMLG